MRFLAFEEMIYSEVNLMASILVEGTLSQAGIGGRLEKEGGLRPGSAP